MDIKEVKGHRKEAKRKGREGRGATQRMEGSIGVYRSGGA